MEIPILYSGGPLDGQTMLTTSLDEVKLMFNVRDRWVYAYRRIDELVWQYEPSMSVQLSAQFDATYEKFGHGIQDRDPGEIDA